MNLNERIGYEMRNQRLLKRMTLEQVAKAMGYDSKNSLSRIERGIKEITVIDLQNFCEVVGCSWIEILEKVSRES